MSIERRTGEEQGHGVRLKVGQHVRISRTFSEFYITGNSEKTVSQNGTVEDF